MKVKFKITFIEFSELVNVIGQLPYANIEVTDIEFINLKAFYVSGINKINTAKLNNKCKMKQISIDVNQYWAIRNVIYGFHEIISMYVISIITLMEYEVEPQINRAAVRNFNRLTT